MAISRGFHWTPTEDKADRENSETLSEPDPSLRNISRDQHSIPPPTILRFFFLPPS